MAILHYSRESRMAIADDPMVCSEEEAGLSVCGAIQPLTLQEWRSYFIKFYGEPPQFFLKEGKHYNLRPFPNQLFEIGFRNRIGLTRIGSVQVRVESRKISESVYKEMLDYIAGKYANLVFSFSTPLGQSYRKEKAGQDIAYIEYLFLKKSLLDGAPNLDGITALILTNPHQRLDREFRYNTMDAIADFSPAMMINMFSAPDRFGRLPTGHPLQSTALGRTIFAKTGKGLYPTEVIEERKRCTVDTNENRFVKHFLQSVQHRLTVLAKALKGSSDGYLNPDIKNCIGDLDRKLGLFLSDPLWTDVGTMKFLPVGSQVLQRRDGYRQLFRLYSLLQLATQCDFASEDFKNILETKDTPTLFEYWSFFVIKDILDGMKKVISSGIIVPDASLEQRVAPGICIRYEDGILLWFNKTYSGSSGFVPPDIPEEDPIIQDSYSHDLRPDIVISKGDKLLIFDAKLKGERGQNSDFYGDSEDGTITSWRAEDIDKMHTYREAIRKTSGAYILYPGEKTIVYPAHDAVNRFEGVGALPLKPDAGARPTERHKSDIKDIIQDFVKET